MPSSVVLIVLLAAIVHALWNAWLRGGGGDRLRVRTIMVVSSSVLCALALPFLPAPKPEAWGFIGMSVCLHLVYNVLLVFMYREGDLGQTYVICRGTQPLLVSLGAAYFAREIPSKPVLAGVVCISIGILMLSRGGALQSRAAIVALVTGAASSGFVVVDGTGIRSERDVLVYACWIVALNGLPMSAVYLAVRRDIRIWQASRSELTTSIIGGILSTVGYGMVIWAMQHGPIGPICALRETSTLFALLFGTALLREQLTVRKLVSAVLISIGVFFIYMF